MSSTCARISSHSDLRERAASYDLEDEINGLLRYFQTHGEVEDDRLPEWSEFQKLEADYEVDLPQ